MKPTQSKAMSTSARVHPRVLPYLHASRSKGGKWVPPVVAMVGIGYAITAYRQSQIEQQLASRAEARNEADRRKRNALLLDAYDDRTSVDEIQHAMRVYEAQQGEE